jgi:serralysin
MSENENHFCVVLTAKDLSIEDQARMAGHKAALLTGAKWDDGESVSVRFLEGAQDLQDRVKKVALEWLKYANLKLDFRKSGPTDIRIAFQPGKGSWSYLGTVCRQIADPDPTMNYGWLTSASPDAEVRRVVLHEFGHALGLIHEHQNPKGGIRWNRDAVVKDLSGPPNNWSLATIESNMFKKYPQTDLVVTDVDPNSIMMYPIPKSWTEKGYFSAGLNSELSDTDKQFISNCYRP